ncbi:hypothetical protein DSO57_1028092 [Entomophthora muscae]|uniref:Uncharacterized protein n=1 Tax=Entomophthora muscae TaxID=34485 RepID=A0ACC2T1H9_9FUNG|nr:hypothetical protein DSO57_1028092 [Entomophthora muscae]
MVILTILSLAKVIIPNLGAYCPLAAGLIYLPRSAPFLYWALVTRYLDGLSSPLMPWYMAATGHAMPRPCTTTHELKPVPPQHASQPLSIKAVGPLPRSRTGCRSVQIAEDHFPDG